MSEESRIITGNFSLTKEEVQKQATVNPVVDEVIKLIDPFLQKHLMQMKYELNQVMEVFATKINNHLGNTAGKWQVIAQRFEDEILALKKIVREQDKRIKKLEKVKKDE